MKRIRTAISCTLIALMLFTQLPYLTGFISPGIAGNAFEASAATLRVKSLWASKHEVGKVTFKWTKVPDATVSGWNLKYRTRKIGGSNSWSGWTTKSYGAGTMQAVIPVKRNYVIEVHAQAAGDSTWSSGIITTPAGGTYQAMKTVYVKNVSTNKRIDSITLNTGATIRTSPDYEYPVSDYKKRPRLYPNGMLYDIADKSIISITDSKGSSYSGGIINGAATIKGVKAGSTTLVCRAPNGRTKVLKVTVLAPVTVKYPENYVQKTIPGAAEYVFDGSETGTGPDGESVYLGSVLASDSPKKIILRGTINLSRRHPVGSNTEIDATDATINSASNGDGCLTNNIDSGNYDAVKNIVIRGGSWKHQSGFKKTMMLFAHASDIRIENVTADCDYSGHCIELIACQNAVIKDCSLKMNQPGITTSPAGNEDEPLQFDHANKVTAPTIPSEYKNNHACKNMQVIHCTLSGGRGLCSGHCGDDESAQNIYHYSIVVQNSNITGESSEALALFNVVACEVTGNTIKTITPDTTYRSDGMCIRIPEKSTAPTDMSRSTITIRNNKVYGGRCGIIVNSLSASNFGKVVITGNTVYYKGDAKNAITVSRYYNNKSTAGCVSKTITGNTTKKGWK